MIYPTLEEAIQILSNGNYRRIPIKMELHADMITPVMALKRLKKVSKQCFMLESAEASSKGGRYTYLGFDPILGVSCKDGILTVSGDRTLQKKVLHPKEIIREILKENLAPTLEQMPPFAGGFAGYFSFDYMKYAEPKVKLSTVGDENDQDVELYLFEKIIAFDHYSHKLMLMINICAEELETAYQKGITELEKMKELLMKGEFDDTPKLQLKSEFRELFSKEEYCEMVEKGKHYIKEGDLFQIVLSNRLEASAEGSLLDTYRVLRTLNPSPYMFYFVSDEVEIAGASPETLVKLNDGELQTFPLAGSRPRGKDDEEDKRMVAELLSDEKECAEHNMLVDLGRNDLGRISEIGSVKVENYMSVEKFSHIMHISSQVTGQIKEGKDALDALDAILPAGTLSGAPKIRACQRICELEQSKRGIYGGAIGYLDLSGNMDTCIGIRLAYKKNGKLMIRTGAGIVADSVPQKEYEECGNKAKAVIRAVSMSAGGIEE